MTAFYSKICKILESLRRKVRYWIKRRIREPLFKKFYVFGLLSGGLYFLAFFADIRWESVWSLENVSYLLVLTYLFFSIGFLCWAYPIAKSVHVASWAKVPVMAFHALALLFGIIPARNLVSASVGLPPEDFDIAVGIIAIGFYPVAWLFLSVVFLLIFYMLGMVFGTLLFIFFSFLIFLTINISSFSIALAQPLVRLQNKVKSILEIAGLHVMGASMTLVSVLFIFQAFIDFSHEANKNVIGLVYFTDYHENSRYPVVREGQKSKIHANGVVSYASLNGSGGLNIEIDKVENFPASRDGIKLDTNINPFEAISKRIKQLIKAMSIRLKQLN